MVKTMVCNSLYFVLTVLKYQILPSEKFSVSLKFKISLAQLKRRISRVPNLIPILVD